MPFNYSPAIWLLLGCVLVQLYYAGYYFLSFTRRPVPDLLPKGAAEPVSVLVCAHNELENLRRLLPLLIQQNYPADFEILLIDDRSTDGTAGLVQQFTQIYPHMRLVSVLATPVGLSPKKYALTLGIKAARYKHLLFTDADCWPATNQWISTMQSGFARPADLVLGYSAYASAPGFLNKLIRFETLLTGAQYLSFAWRGYPYMGVGRNLAYTKSCFQATKGFASHLRRLGGDDDLLVQDAVAQGQRVGVQAQPAAQTISWPAQTWRAWWRQKRRHLSAGPRYTWKDQVRIGTFIGTNLLFYFTAILLVFSRPDWIPLAVIWAVRTGAMSATYARLGRHLADRLPFWLLPVLDAAYFFNYLALGISLFLYRTLRWK
ncbi:glycosyl transferase family 2 [Hymenobacter roseosalivarius DSM 11622]|uniref:Glycosyl transferase family 2 n=1 Tax=Hymenobacter roseosalivarius DSM 11622 TaxID=645990 RepID=A0A1W1V7W1_9BACT|nr:glycosyltransferase [Hymenobacter roseosalivarius]SMB89121.1 glycosyl transferase family 2 [Hymenobacter roseosalivarius DSM 11622]